MALASPAACLCSVQRTLFSAAPISLPLLRSTCNCNLSGAACQPLVAHVYGSLVQCVHSLCLDSTRWMFPVPLILVSRPCCCQVGDAVVYIPEGHRICLHNTRDKRPGPWDTVTAPGPRGRLRAAEPARVEGLRYAITDDGRRDTARPMP